MKKAVLIGCNYQNTPYELNGCINDIDTMRNLLKKYFNYTDSEIIIMTDDLDKSSKFYPTKNNIMNMLKNTFINTLDQIYIHYSGHGSNIIDRNKDELDNFDECIIPADYYNGQYIIDDELYTLFTYVKPSCQLLLSLDCCMSGTICDLNYCYNYNHITRNFNVSNVNKKNIYETKNIISFSAVQDNQSALDVYVNNKSQGAFTMSINNVLNKYGNNISFASFFTYVYNDLRNNGYTSMTPMISSSKNINLNNLRFGFIQSINMLPLNNNKKKLLKK